MLLRMLPSTPYTTAANFSVSSVHKEFIWDIGLVEIFARDCGHSLHAMDQLRLRTFWTPEYAPCVLRISDN